MHLKVGGLYKTRNGKFYRIMGMTPKNVCVNIDRYPFMGMSIENRTEREYFMDTGRYDVFTAESNLDLIEEVDSKEIEIL